MQKKIRLQKLLIIVLAVMISFLLVGFLLGRGDVVSVVVVNGETLDANKFLNEQTDQMRMEKMSEEELSIFNGKLVTSFDQLEGKKLLYPLKKDSPIPLDALTEVKPAGQAASETPAKHTTFNMPDTLGALPPGVQPGDRIDINLIVDMQGSNGENRILSGPFLQNIKIEDIQDTNLFLQVTKQQFNELSLAQKVGTFIVQLPGKKKVDKCSDVLRKMEEDKVDAIEKVQSNKKYSDEEKADMVSVIESQHQLKVENAECAEDDYETSTIDNTYILNKLMNNIAVENGDDATAEFSELIENGKIVNPGDEEKEPEEEADNEQQDLPNKEGQ